LLLQTNAQLKATENKHTENAYAYKAMALEMLSKTPVGTGWATGSCIASGMSQVNQPPRRAKQPLTYDPPVLI